MGIFPRRSAKLTFKMFSPMVKHLSSQLGRPVVLETSANFKDFWNGVTNLRYDIVHYNQYHYIRSHKRLGYDVIAMNEEFGRATISGSLHVRSDSGLKSLQDLKGTKIVFGGGPKAMMSYIMPTYVLRQAGLVAGDYQEAFARTPANAIFSIYYKQSSAAGVGDIVSQLPSVKSKVDTTKLKQLAASEAVAHLPWAVRGDISAKLRSQLQQLLVNLDHTIKGKRVLEYAGLTAMVAAKDEDYHQIRKITLEVLGEHY